MLFTPLCSQSCPFSFLLCQQTSSFWADLSYAACYRTKVVIKPHTAFLPRLLEASGVIFRRNQQGRWWCLQVRRWWAGLASEGCRATWMRDTLKSRQGWGEPASSTCMEVTRVVLQGNQSLTLFLGSHCDRVPLWSARTLTHVGWGTNRRC